MDTATSSDSEEEILVYAEFEDSVNMDKYRSIHVLGVNGPNPIVQMDDSFFTGQYKNALGTYMFFEEDPSPQCEDPLFDKLAEHNLKYVCKTNKLMKMEHAYVLPKEGQEQNVKKETDAEDDDDIQPAHFTTVQEALSAIIPELNINTTAQEDKAAVNPSIPMETKQT